MTSAVENLDPFKEILGICLDEEDKMVSQLFKIVMHSDFYLHFNHSYQVLGWIGIHDFKTFGREDKLTGAKENKIPILGGRCLINPSAMKVYQSL